MALDSIMPTPAPQPPKAAARSASSSSSPSSTEALGRLVVAGASSGSKSASSSGSKTGRAASPPAAMQQRSGQVGQRLLEPRHECNRVQREHAVQERLSELPGAAEHLVRPDSIHGGWLGIEPANGAARPARLPDPVSWRRWRNRRRTPRTARVPRQPSRRTCRRKTFRRPKASQSGQESDDTDPTAASLLDSCRSPSPRSMAGVHSSPPRGRRLASTATDSASADGSSIDGVSLASGSSIQNIVASLTKGTAAGLKAGHAATTATPKSVPQRRPVVRRTAVPLRAPSRRK